MKIHIVAEGLLDASAAEKIIRFCGHSCGTPYVLRGSGNIKKTATTYAELVSDTTAVLVLTDLMDSGSPCPKEAKKLYLEGLSTSYPQHFLLRFSVKELESWLLADYKNFSQMLSIKENKISSHPDLLEDPKKHIASLARCSRKKVVREDLVSSKGRQGREYIPIMTDFVVNHWNISLAMLRSPSLARCIKRLRELTPA